eukprot:1548618-Prymnesium_polylepis.1
MRRQCAGASYERALAAAFDCSASAEIARSNSLSRRACNGALRNWRRYASAVDRPVSWSPTRSAAVGGGVTRCTMRAA